MSNKFLGINSINVLKKYIDEQIVIAEENTRVITLHAYAYHKNGITPVAPKGEQGGFDPEGANIMYPAGWGPLHTVINNLVNDDANSNEAIETALSEGSIWMTIGVAEGANGFDNWSTPIKISGQNGVSVRFKYAYSPDTAIDDCSDVPLDINATNRIVYVWTKYGDDPQWRGPVKWAIWTEDASDVLYRYCVTETLTTPAPPTDDNDSNWMKNPALSLSPEKPYLWMVSKRVPAGIESDNNWDVEPILFSHYGLDGSIPDYSITLYALSDSIETKPEFVCNENDSIDDIKTNNPNWSELPPETATDNTIIWYVVLNIYGGSRENLNSKDTIKAFSDVKRFSAIDGDIKTSVYTKYLFYWSSDAELPENITDEDWTSTPEFDDKNQEGSLWMKFGVAQIDTLTNTETMVNTDKPYSDPVRLTGPRGPIAYDYRVDSQYGAGTADVAPTTWKNMKDVKVSDKYPYIWENRRLCVYKMKYADDGSIEQDGTSPIKVISQEIFRLSGLNGIAGEPGKNGNRLNTVDYATKNNDNNIYNFDEINYFISNSSEDTVYNLIGNKFGDFVSGYTGKFANIGTGNMIITTEESILTGIDIDDSTQMILYPGETVEIVTYNDNGECLFISLGKNSKSTPVATTTIE